MSPEPMVLASAVQELLRCPVCGERLDRAAGKLLCSGLECGRAYPIVDGVPILLSERDGLFSIQALVRQSKVGKLLAARASGGSTGQAPGSTDSTSRVPPKRGWNLMCERNFAQLARLLLADSDEPRVLVVGGRVLGQGIEHLLGQPDIELVETDVAFGPRTGLICDAHDIPFEDGTFDGVIAQGVLEHVVDPHRCVAEMHRVLRADGLVYAETAFMQQVHGGRFDFMRFTPLGHRRLLRAFSELDSGVLCGPGMALAWSYRYFLLSFARSRRARAVIDAFARATSSFLQYADRWLISRPGAFDAASAVYFMGRRSEQALTDRELITLYRGAQVGDTGPRPSAPRSGMRP